MQEKHSDDPTDEQMIDNFSDVKFCCLKCGSRNVTVNGPTARHGELEDEQVHILEQYFSVIKLLIASQDTLLLLSIVIIVKIRAS
jgi:hypothetical protein